MRERARESEREKRSTCNHAYYRALELAEVCHCHWAMSSSFQRLRVAAPHDCRFQIPRTAWGEICLTWTRHAKDTHTHKKDISLLSAIFLPQVAAHSDDVLRLRRDST